LTYVAIKRKKAAIGLNDTSSHRFLVLETIDDFHHFVISSRENEQGSGIKVMGCNVNKKRAAAVVERGRHVSAGINRRILWCMPLKNRYVVD